MLKEDVEARLRRRGVLDIDNMHRIGSRATVLATRFDNILVLGTPVGLGRLRDIGCVDRRNLVTAQPALAQHAAIILREGQAHG